MNTAVQIVLLIAISKPNVMPIVPVQAMLVVLKQDFVDWDPTVGASI